MFFYGYNHDELGVLTLLKLFYFKGLSLINLVSKGVELIHVSAGDGGLRLLLMMMRRRRGMRRRM